MEAIIANFPGCGYRTIGTVLRKQGKKINHKKILRIMHESKLTSNKTIKFQCKTTDSSHNLRKYVNLVGKTKASKMNMIIVGDVTQFSNNGKDQFLATLMDQCNREVIGRAISDNNNTDLVLCALHDAINTRGANNLKGCIHHTDSDVRYCSSKYIKELENFDFKISMCKGNAHENAHAESLFKTIKYQEINVNSYQGKLDGIRRIFEYIDKYNLRRPHSSLKGLSPIEFRNKMEMALKKDDKRIKKSLQF